MKTKKSRILLSAVSVLLVFSLLVGGTMAWFTDTEKVDANFTAGILDINVNPGDDGYTTQEPLVFENLRPMQYENFYAELNAAGGDNNVAANEMDINDFGPHPVYFKPVTIKNDGTLPTKVDISVKLGDKCEEGEENIKLTENNKKVDWDGKKNGDCTNGLQEVLKIFVYKNVDGTWTRIEGVNLNKLYKEAAADPKGEAEHKTELETKNMYTTAMIPAGKDATYVIAGYLPETVGNAYQGKHYHADLMFNAYQMDTDAGGGNPDEGGSSSEDPNPDRFNDNLTIEWRLNTAEGDKVASREETVKADTKIEATKYDAPTGYVYSPIATEQSKDVAVDNESGVATPNTVVFTVKEEEVPAQEKTVSIEWWCIDPSHESDHSAGTTTYTFNVGEGETKTISTADVGAPANGYYVSPDPQTVSVSLKDGKLVDAENEEISTIRFTVKGVGGNANFPEGGNGTINHPYLISNQNELDKVRNNMDAHYKLIKDISMSGNWTPIGITTGDSDRPFNGTLDGNEKTISGLRVSMGSDNAGGGLFAYNKGGIKDLTVTGASINIGSIAGILAGQNAGTIENCHVSGAVTTTSYTLANLGGASTYTGSFTGGLVGVNGGTIKKASADVDIRNTYTRNEGTNGISGCIGGLTGINYAGTIEECWANAKVNQQWYQNSNVNANLWFVGGLVGHNDNGSVIKNCWGTGNPICGGDYIGGLVGINRDSSVISSYGRVVGWTIGQYADAGDCIGHNNRGTITNAYYAYKSTSGYGTRLNTLTDGANLSGFDTSVWNFVAGEYPDLKSNPRA